MTEIKKHLDNIKPGDVVVLGIPFDKYSSFKKGAAMAPAHIRDAYNSYSSNRCTESVRDLGEDGRLVFFPDLEVKDFITDIEAGVSAILERGGKVLSLGGDHSITYPVLRAYEKKVKLIKLLHLDAHPDLYQEFEGNPHSHACPMARIMEDGLAARLVQIGIRTLNPHQQEQGERFHGEILTMKNLTSDGLALPDLPGPVYVSLDLDVLDPAFAPGVSHPEPGGLSTRDVVHLIQQLKGPVIGADVVELNPGLDPSGITAMVAAKFLKELVDKMLG